MFFFRYENPVLGYYRISQEKWRTNQKQLKRYWGEVTNDIW
jgi:hypothetical protein